MNDIQLNFNQISCVYEEYKSPTVKISATSDSCDCLGRTSMLLPCRHILMVRKMEQKDLFEKSLCNNRWTNHYYYETQRVFSTCDVQIDIPEAVICSREYKQKVLSENEKYRKANEITKQLPGLVAEVGTKSYLRRMKVLADLVESWQNNEEVKIIKVKDINQDNNESSKVHKHRISRRINESSENNSDSDADGDNDSDIGTCNNKENDNENNDNNHYDLQNVSSDEGDNADDDDGSNGEDDNHDDELNEIIKYVESMSSSIQDNSFVNENQEISSVNKNDSMQKLTTIRSGTTPEKKQLKILSNIVVQPALKRRGRPKGTDNTVIGLPKKTKRDNKENELPFNKKKKITKKKI
ncbi:unnamed protein product [Colias eurytheme]|nr:unnamed protein product [Colias eurytheme]